MGVVYVRQIEDRYMGKHDRGYAPILDPPDPPSEIDSIRLLIQWIIVVVITGGFIVTLKDRKGPLTPRKT